MPVRTVLDTQIESISILDEGGGFDAELGKGLIPDKDVVKLYEHMGVCRQFDLDIRTHERVVSIERVDDGFRLVTTRSAHGVGGPDERVGTGRAPVEVLSLHGPYVLQVHGQLLDGLPEGHQLSRRLGDAALI